MPELECVGGPKDGELLSFYGDYLDFPLPHDAPADGRWTIGRYTLERHASPLTGAARMVWRWRDAIPHEEDGA